MRNDDPMLRRPISLSVLLGTDIQFLVGGNQEFKVSKFHGTMKAWAAGIQNIKISWKHGNMGGELFKKLIENCGRIPDIRRPGHNERCRTADFLKSAFGVGLQSASSFSAGRCWITSGG
jgi:hypothetical protein